MGYNGNGLTPNVLGLVGPGGAGVPSTRTITTTSPLRIDGGASADLSANRTLSILAASTSQDGSMSAASMQQLAMLDPLATFPSYGTVSGLFQGPACTDCLTSAAVGLGPYSTSTSGAGATIANGTGTTSRPGIVSFDTGTDAAGRSGAQAPSTQILPGGGVWRFRADINIPTASDGTNTFIDYAGFMNLITGAPTVGAFFRYTHSENGGNWTYVTVDKGAENTQDSGVAAVHATDFRALEVEINAAASSVTFYVNGANAWTTTTAVPTAALGIMVNNRKTAGGTSRSMLVDLMGSRFAATAAR